MQLAPTTLKRRCAIYTRKSHEEGLEQDFNSLDAQRDAGETFIASQKHEGWITLGTRYDDGGWTGANTERPALKRLLADIEAGLIDIVVVYKIDRLSRSLLDFVNLLQVFERRNVAFVSVTQQFNTANPMGRLVLNILICFAQFERENIAERIRDKMAASRRRGKWVGGSPPLGYDVDYAAGKLVINEAEAETVRWIFNRMAQVRSAGLVMQELNERGTRTKAWTSKTGKCHPGNRWDRGNIYRLLANRTYLGVCHYQGKDYPGEHTALITQELWDAAHIVLEGNHVARGNRERAKVSGFLKGLCRCAGCGSAMTMSWTRGKQGAYYRYYRCSGEQKNGVGSCSVMAVAAGVLETAVLTQIRDVFRSPRLVQATSVAAQAAAGGAGVVMDHVRVLSALQDLGQVWEELFPAEQMRVAEQLIEHVQVGIDCTTLYLRTEALVHMEATSDERSTFPTSGSGVAIRLLLKATKRSRRTRLIADSSAGAEENQEGSEQSTSVDAIDFALARAFRWLDDLTSGRAATVAAIATKENIDDSYVRRLMNATLLAPQIVTMIIEHDVPDISLKELIRPRFKWDWLEQMALFGADSEPRWPAEVFG